MPNLETTLKVIAFIILISPTAITIGFFLYLLSNQGKDK